MFYNTYSIYYLFHSSIGKRFAVNTYILVSYYVIKRMKKS